MLLCKNRHDLYSSLSKFFVCALAVSIPLSKTAIHISLLFALFFFILKKISERQWLSPTPLSKPIAIFLCYALISLLWGNHPELNIRGMVKLFKDFAVFFLIVELFQEQNSLKNLIRCLLAGAVITCLNGFFQYFNALDLLYSQEFGTRITSTFKNPTVLSTYIVCILPLPTLFLKAGNLKNNLLYLSVIALFAMIFIFSFSRNTFFLFSLTLIFLGWFGTPFKRFTKIALITLFIISLLFIKLSQTHSIAQMIINPSISPSLAERAYLWKIAKEMISDHPLAGHGINSYAEIRANYFPPRDQMPPSFSYLHDAHPHNSYLKIWIESGLIGLLLYLSIFFVFLIFIMKVLKKAPHNERRRLYPYMIGLSVFVVSSLFDTFLMGALQLRMVFWLTAALLVVELKTLECSSIFEAVPTRDAAMVPADEPQT
jgi:O-antigen ligase